MNHSPTDLAGRLRSLYSPLTKGGGSPRVGLRAFPRHYSNIRWRVFLAERRKVAR